MDNKMIFNIFKNVIIEQNKVLLKQISDKYNIDYDYLVEKYIDPQYYLPVIMPTTSNIKKDTHNKK